MAVSDRGFYYFPEYRESNTPRDHEDFDRLERILVNWHSFEWLQRWQARRFVRALLLSLAFRGRFHDLTAARSWEVRLFAAMYSLGFQIDGWIPLADLNASDFSKGWVTYRLPGHYIPGDIVNRDIGFFSGLLSGDAIVRAGEVAGSVQVCRLFQFPSVVPLSAQQIAALPKNIVAIGLDRITGEQVEIDVAKCFHLLICGASRWGKSVLLHCIMSQLLAKPKSRKWFSTNLKKTVEVVDAKGVKSTRQENITAIVKQGVVSRIYAADLKGGVELSQYGRTHADRVTVVRDVASVMSTVRDLVALLHLRLDIMDAKRWKTWQGDRVFFVCDEMAIVEQWTPARNDEAGKAAKSEMQNNLLELSQQAAGAGIIMVCAIQKATADGMATTFGSNFEGICQFRTLTKNTATQVLGTTEDLLIDPVKGLARGECIYRDPAAGEDRYIRVFFTDAAKDSVPDEDVNETMFDDVADAA
jgi:hypothetical protein